MLKLLEADTDIYIITAGKLSNNIFWGTYEGIVVDDKNDAALKYRSKDPGSFYDEIKYIRLAHILEIDICH